MQGLVARFRTRLGAFALDVAFEAPARGVIAVFGPSGSGKTTLLQCVAGLERAAEGFLCLAGETWQDEEAGVFRPTHRRPIGYVFQEARLFEHLSVRRNLEYGYRRIPAAQRRVVFDQAVALLGLGALLPRSPAHLSGGERQRVAIGRALLTSPQLLLMDEPLAALDERSKAEILPYLERLHRELAVPLLYVSHAADEIARLADHLLLIDRGRQIAAGPFTELSARPDLPFARGEEAGAVIETCVQAHDEHFALTELSFAGGRLWVGRLPLAPGARARVRIHARDVSLSLAAPTGSSVLNRVPSRVAAVEAEGQPPGLVLVRLTAGETRLLARITGKSAVELDLRPGRKVIALIKGAAVIA